VRLGKVLAVGPGRYDKKTGKQHSMDVEPGERVAFFRENLLHKPGEQVTRVLQELGENLAMLRVIDLLCVVGDDTKVEFY
jgi:co-chaperonin GroES (HSP10)